jgi:hypothetical protein
MCSLYLGDQIISGQATLVGESRNIGQIIPSAIPLTDAGLHLLDGALIQGSGIYSAFVDYIAGLDLTANYFCTEQEWQTSVTQYGVCGKFVYDSTNNTVRLPKVTGIIEGTTDVSALGDLVEAGLPNITGGYYQPNTAAGGFAGVTYGVGATGAFHQLNGVSGCYSSASGSTNVGLGFDASLSNPIYGNSSTVQPQTIKAFYYIVIATSTKTDIEVDIDEVVTDLNGKVDKSSLQEVQCVVETYQNGTSWYRVYSDGWCEQGGSSYIASDGASVTLLKTFTNTNYNIQCTGRNGSASECLYVKSRTASSFSLYTGDDASFNAGTIDWQASGYMAV